MDDDVAHQNDFILQLLNSLNKLDTDEPDTKFKQHFDDVSSAWSEDSIAYTPAAMRVSRSWSGSSSEAGFSPREWGQPPPRRASTAYVKDLEFSKKCSEMNLSIEHESFGSLHTLPPLMAEAPIGSPYLPQPTPGESRSCGRETSTGQWSSSGSDAPRTPEHLAVSPERRSRSYFSAAASRSQPAAEPPPLCPSSVASGDGFPSPQRSCSSQGSSSPQTPCSVGSASAPHDLQPCGPASQQCIWADSNTKWTREPLFPPMRDPGLQFSPCTTPFTPYPGGITPPRGTTPTRCLAPLDGRTPPQCVSPSRQTTPTQRFPSALGPATKQGLGGPGGPARLQSFTLSSLDAGTPPRGVTPPRQTTPTQRPGSHGGPALPSGPSPPQGVPPFAVYGADAQGRLAAQRPGSWHGSAPHGPPNTSFELSPTYPPSGILVPPTRYGVDTRQPPSPTQPHRTLLAKSSGSFAALQQRHDSWAMKHVGWSGQPPSCTVDAGPASSPAAPPQPAPGLGDPLEALHRVDLRTGEPPRQGNGPTGGTGHLTPTGEVSESKFPVSEMGRCNHTPFWTRLRGKRKHSYFYCTHCGLGWRQPTREKQRAMQRQQQQEAAPQQPIFVGSHAPSPIAAMPPPGVPVPPFHMPVAPLQHPVQVLKLRTPP